MFESGELSFTGILHVELAARVNLIKIFFILIVSVYYIIYNRKGPTEFISEGRIIYYFIKNCEAV